MLFAISFPDRLGGLVFIYKKHRHTVRCGGADIQLILFLLPPETFLSRKDQFFALILGFFAQKH